MKPWIAALSWFLYIQVTGLVLAEDPVNIEPLEKWSNVFGDSKVERHYIVRADKPLEGRLTWSFTVKHRIVARGEEPVNLQAGRATDVAVQLRVPPVNEGVVIEGQLAVAVWPQGGNRAAANHVQPLSIFSRNPFADRSKWLKDLRITLFDPKGKTADLFENAEIPFKFTRNMASLNGLTEGLVIIGEGASFKDHRGLAQTMIDVAASGVPVLCLAPASGRFPMPGAGLSAQPSPCRVSLRRQDVILDLDKRLDAIAWPSDGRLIDRSFSILSDRDLVVFEVTPDVDGWTWIDVEYPRKGSRLLLCSFSIVGQWDAGPTPRFLLARLFERLMSEEPLSAKPKEE